MIRLIASDIDGTLLQNGATEIAPAIFREIDRLRTKGILFCPASGRQYHSLRRLFAPVADELAYVCENGAVVFGPGNP
ncbi:MAG: HAD-IIB family hydrolase, partial [Lawsonibacter sp.]